MTKMKYYLEKKFLPNILGKKKIFPKYSSRKKNLAKIFYQKIRKKIIINFFVENKMKICKKKNLHSIFGRKKIFLSFSAKKKNLPKIF